jgi:hypothetical protein
MTVQLDPAPAEALTDRMLDVLRRAVRLAKGQPENRARYERRRDALLAELRAKDEAAGR